VRKIDIGVELEGAGRMDSKGLLSTLLKSQSARDFTRMFGSLFAAYLLCGEECLSTQQKDLVISQAERLLASSLAEEIRSLLTQDWQGLFYKLFKKSFSLKLTTDNGWLDVDNYIVVPYSRDDGKAKAGLRILLSLGQEVEPITSYMPEVHGGDLNTRLPVLQCCINHQSHFYPYSVFQQLVISALHLSVDVKGLKNVVAYNQHGQLDPSTPFQPFGPLPGSNAYLVFGNYEIARKRLTGLDLNLEWGELPQNAGGFDEYYRGYQTQYGNRIFKGEFSALSDGSWQPYERAAGQHVDLFTSEDNGGRLLAKKSMTVDVLSYSKPAEPGILEEDFQYSLKCRNGFFRLSLAAPATAFGHAEYPEILTEVLTANARLKKPRQPPNPPYTPILNSISLDYRASSTINPALRQDERSADAAQIIHLHPFGTEIVHPALSDKPCFFLPQYTHDGNLFIGLSANNLTGSITLFFHLTAEVAQESLNKRLSVDWFYLTSNSWKAIPANRVLSDTTNGFLSSGIVSLNIPEDINRDNSVMPSDYYWLRAAVAHEQGSICRAYSVQANALRVIRESHEDAAEINTYPAAAKWTTVSAVPGISSIKQPGNGFGGKAGETDIELRTRGSERLRHKNRALVPWDYERLVLEQFPDIYKVKCFSNISAKEESIKPGSVLIVVVPTSRAKQDDICAKVMVGADRLDQIRSFVKNISSHFADIEVRNPVYEEIQVRCSVKFVDGISDGINMNRLNGAISRYICPWNKGGYKARFGWSIRQKDIESYIRSLNYVDFVTNFSMLHITMDRDGRYSLFDTAKDTGNNEVIIRPRYPWSLAIPVKKHFIETIRASRSIKAEITGVDELEVGSTFIISGNSGYGEEK